LLLEAGGEEPNVAQVPAFDSLLFGSKLDWNYTTEPQNFNCDGHGCKFPRGKVLGGSSTINGMTYIRGFPEDYDHWAAEGNALFCSRGKKCMPTECTHFPNTFLCKCSFFSCFYVHLVQIQFSFLY
jgi:choline dehydrogenase-like flavoprotein